MDLRQACETILSRLDVRAEAEALGVEFAAASPSPSGWLPCRAVGRVDRNPSAALNVGSDGLRGLYRDLGDAGGRAIGFFDLAVTTGRFPDRDSAVRHYAEKAGVGIPPASSGVPHAARSLEDRVAWIPAGPSDPADLDAWCRRKSGILPAALRAFGARKCRWPRNPASGSPCWCLAGRREDSNAPVALLLYRADGADFPATDTLKARKTHLVGGSRDSWLWPGTLEDLRHSETIVKVEGPTDAMALWPLLPAGWAVVTNVAGASANPDRLAMEFARGKLVYVVGDADRAGQAGASRFARAFARVAREVRLVPLPYETAESHGKDLRDWVAEGGGPEGLRDLLEAATPVAAAEPPEEDPSEGAQGGLVSPTPITPKEAVNDPHRLARRLLVERFGGLGQPELRFWREDFWRWKGDCYRAVNAADLRAEIAGAVKEILDREYLRAYAADLAEAAAGEGSRPKVPNVCRVTGPLVSDVRLALSSLCGIAADLEQPAWLDGEAPFPAAEVLVARNGLLHLPSLVAGQPSLLPPTPAFFSANALDYAFDPTAECPGWLQFLGALWPEDPQAIGLLQEWLGYLLLPDTSQQKMLALLGPKRSGKGTIARVIRRLVGAPNVCAPTMSGLQAGFGLSPLLGKSVAIIGDARLSGRADAAVIVERLLSLTGEDALTVERKYREAVTTKLYARLILISNELPSLRDASGALASRMLVLQLVRSWYGTEDPDLTDRLLTELPGILNWSIAGWQRLRERGRFAQPDSGRELLESLEELASPVGTFVKECCWVGPGYHVGVKVLYDRWRSWCEETGRDYTGDLQHFGKNLRAVVPGLRLSRPRADQERVRFYEGIDLKLTGADF